MPLALRSAVLVLLAVHPGVPGSAGERRESFDGDPKWDGHNNRSQTPAPRKIRQDFGYCRSQLAGGETAGECGGLITPAAEPAWYAKPIEPASFDSRLHASGTLAAADGHFHVLLGFFDHRTVKEWRTSNSIVLRLYGRGDVFYAYVEYATDKWRAGGDSPGGFATVIDTETRRERLRGFASRKKPHRWSLTYDPMAHEGAGSITATIDDETAVCHLSPGHRGDGAVFNRFGLMSIPKSADTGGEIWIDDVTVNGAIEYFDTDPRWEERGNRRAYETYIVRPRFDFGYSLSQFAGGTAPGELGGLVFRGDDRIPEKMAYYGDRLAPLTAAKPLRAAGKVALHRGNSDSTSLIGFFHSKDSLHSENKQSAGLPLNFLGVAIEGPSSEGFLFYPAYRIPRGSGYNAQHATLPHILPDGRAHDWTLEYDPRAGETKGRIRITFDGHAAELEVPASQRGGERFDRFGIVTTWVDGNEQTIYFDDLLYTDRQD